MYICAQASVTAARKIFRIMRPLESLTPVLMAPGFAGKQPLIIEAINKASPQLVLPDAAGLIITLDDDDH